MNQTYDPKSIEQHCYQIWERSGLFKPSGHGESYCIMLPPPNVTGTLHMGHGFQQTLMDALIRYHRMRGCNTLWQAGTDHAGIATQMVVERQLLQIGKTRHELGRDVFIERVWEWKHQSDGTIKKQMRRLGASADWSRERFTLDESISLAVLKVFIDLYEKKLIYRGKRLVNWDPVLLTAVSDLEVVSEEVQGSLWHIRYPLENENEYITVATTRPETLFGDVAVAVHPDDKRYQHLIGKKLKLPLTERTIPIIADAQVVMEFGSGCVKITPAHDFNDNLMGQRHQLPSINIFTPDAHLNNNVPEIYQGLERFKARALVVKDLQAQNLIEKIVPHTLQVPKGDRSGAILEPYLTDQWFIATKTLAQPAMQAVKKGEIKFVPDHWSKIYFQWLENIQDWCISRQLWWGHRIPAWYDQQGNVYVGQNETDVRKKYKLDATLKLKQDEDVLDTWFSAALWPFATLGWPDETSEFKTFYPTNVLVTGFDIIFFWVARMIMMGIHFTGKVPFREVYIHGLIRDAEGQKMSKSKGNVLDPIDLIDGIALEDLIQKRISGLMQPQMAKRIETNTSKEFPNGIPAYGTDALRFTFCALASPGREIRFDLGRLEGYRNFCNKIWNAARFVLMHISTPPSKKENTEGLILPNRWILSRLHKTISQINTAFANYRFDLLAQSIYEFVWNEYCDWYLEFSKPLLTAPEFSAEIKQATQQTLIEVLETLLRLLHPIMPFVTEEIWQQIKTIAGKTGSSIMIQPYPQAKDFAEDLVAEKEMEWLKKIIIAIRNIRGEMNISPKKSLAVYYHKGTKEDREKLQRHRQLILSLAKLESLDELSAGQTFPVSATGIVDDLELHIPLTDLIDKEAEVSRLQKELIKMQKDFEITTSRLKNDAFVAKAPAAVVTKERERVKDLELTINKLEEQIKKLTS